MYLPSFSREAQLVEYAAEGVVDMLTSGDGPTWMVAKVRSVQKCFQLFENVAGPSSVVCVVEQCSIM